MADAISFSALLVEKYSALETRMWRVLRTALLQMFDDMVSLCPVDTGYLCSHMYLSSRPKSDIAPASERDPKGSYPPPDHPTFRRSKSYTFGNTTEYADEIEYGHSSKAPNGFMRPVLANFPQYIKEARSSFGLRKRKWLNPEEVEWEEG